MATPIKANEIILHLTVNHEGRISLWDSAEIAQRGMEKHEVYCPMGLTAQQIRRVQDARHDSADKLKAVR